jgi:exopolysaccharide biosynthesis predicted pyruvyltransferase EpsI
MAFFLSLASSRAQESDGYFFRTDVESAGWMLPDNNEDLSSMGNQSTPIDEFVKKISIYERIHTDRLHIGIASALLEREVHLHSNNYFKIESIYDSSIKDFYPKVKFYKLN